MSRCSWRSAEALQKRRKALKAVQRADAKARFRRQQEIDEWHITGEPPFQPRRRFYPNGGGVDGRACEDFLGSAERAIHLYDRGKALTAEMSSALARLERRNTALVDACVEFGRRHSSHLHPDAIKTGKWEVGVEELQLFVKAAERMTSEQRHAFTQALAPGREKGNGHMEPLPPLAASLQRATKASIDQAISRAMYSPTGEGQTTRRFAREVRFRGGVGTPSCPDSQPLAAARSSPSPSPPLFCDVSNAAARSGGSARKVGRLAR